MKKKQSRVFIALISICYRIGKLLDDRFTRTIVWDIIFAWTGVTDIVTASRSQNVSDARKLYSMERLW
jgi:hypothetical protein